MDLQFKADAAAQAFDVVVKDKFGNAVTGSVTASVADSSIATAALSADGSSLAIAPAGAGKLGSTAVTLTDAASSLTAAVNVSVVAGEAVSIDITPHVDAASTATAATSDSTAAAAATPAATTPTATGE